MKRSVLLLLLGFVVALHFGGGRLRAEKADAGSTAAKASAQDTAAGKSEADERPNPAASLNTEKVDRIAVNVAWTLATAFLLIMMQAGFAMIETGLTRSKNVTHTMTMNLMAFALGVLGFFAIGFALMYGGSSGAGGLGSSTLVNRELSLHLFGHDFGISGGIELFLPSRINEQGLLALFFSLALVANIAATIPTGAMAERWKFRAFVYFILFMTGIVFPIFANWAWGGGWLAQIGANLGLGRGFIDFAGSSVVHLVGGVAAIAGCRALGPRIGKYNRDGSLNVLLPHSVPLYMAGTMILAFGWFGLTTGRALVANDPIVSRVATNTLVAAAAGATAAMVYMWMLYKKPDPSFMCNGLLAGLVAVSAPCAYVTPLSAMLIGLIAGVLVVWSVLFLERATRLDDPVGAISVHGVCGLWGVLAVGLFANGSYREVTGILHGGGAGQLGAQCLGAVACVVWVYASTSVFFWLVGRFVGNRVGPTTELQGLDVPELGVVGYFNEDPAAAKGSMSRQMAEPRAATAPPPASENRFSIVIDGADAATIKAIWNDFCQPSDRPSDPDFVAVYPLMTLIKGSRFRFRGGQPEDIRSRLERLIAKRLPDKPIRARIET